MKALVKLGFFNGERKSIVQTRGIFEPVCPATQKY